MAKDRDFSGCLDIRNQLIASSGYHQIYYIIQLATKSKEEVSEPYLNLKSCFWSKVHKGVKLHMSAYHITSAQTRRLQELSYFPVPIVYLK
jgi:hypothetical protein